MPSSIRGYVRKTAAGANPFMPTNNPFLRPGDTENASSDGAQPDAKTDEPTERPLTTRPHQIPSAETNTVPSMPGPTMANPTMPAPPMGAPMGAPMMGAPPASGQLQNAMQPATSPAQAAPPMQQGFASLTHGLQVDGAFDLVCTACGNRGGVDKLASDLMCEACGSDDLVLTAELEGVEAAQPRYEIKSRSEPHVRGMRFNDLERAKREHAKSAPVEDWYVWDRHKKKVVHGALDPSGEEPNADKLQADTGDTWVLFADDPGGLMGNIIPVGSFPSEQAAADWKAQNLARDDRLDAYHPVRASEAQERARSRGERLGSLKTAQAGYYVLSGGVPLNGPYITPAEAYAAMGESRGKAVQYLSSPEAARGVSHLRPFRDPSGYQATDDPALSWKFPGGGSGPSLPMTWGSRKAKLAQIASSVHASNPGMSLDDVTRIAERTLALYPSTANRSAKAAV